MKEFKMSKGAKNKHKKLAEGIQWTLETKWERKGFALSATTTRQCLALKATNQGKVTLRKRQRCIEARTSMMARYDYRRGREKKEEEAIWRSIEEAKREASSKLVAIQGVGHTRRDRRREKGKRPTSHCPDWRLVSVDASKKVAAHFKQQMAR